VEARFWASIQNGPGAHPASCTIGTGSCPGVKSGRGVTLTPIPLLVPWSRKCRAITLVTLWAIQPEQSLSACTRVHFTLQSQGTHVNVILFLAFSARIFTQLKHALQQYVQISYIEFRPNQSGSEQCSRHIPART
jgi:hypothetical protein